MENTEFKERRIFPRFSVTIPAQYTFIDAGEYDSCVTHDISIRGINLITNSDLPEGACLEVVLIMRDNGEEIKNRGTIVWRKLFEGKKFRVGIKLDNPALKPIPLVLRSIKIQRKY